MTVRKARTIYWVGLGVLVIAWAIAFSCVMSGCDAAPIVYPQATGWVLDQPGVLKAPTQDAIRAHSQALASHGGPEVVVAIISNIGEESVEQYSIHLAEVWKVGKKGKDNGVILLVAMAQKKIRIEVGTGLEPVLNDAKAGRIIHDVISPRLHQGDFDGGVRAGYEAICQAIKN